MSKKVDKIKLDFSALAEQWLASVSHGVKESTLAHYDYTFYSVTCCLYSAHGKSMVLMNSAWNRECWK